MIDIRISLPIAMNAVCSISFEDSEGSYILTAPNAGEVLLEQIGMLMEGNHPNKKLQQTYSFLGLRAVELDVLESMIPVDDLANRGQHYINDCINCFNDGSVDKSIIPDIELFNDNMSSISDYNEQVTKALYEGEIKKVVKVLRNPGKITKDRYDIIDTYSTTRAACADNPNLVIDDIKRQLGKDNISYYTNLDYYFCFNYELGSQEPHIIPNNKPTYQITN